MIRLRLLGSLSLERDDGAAVRSVLAQPKRLALLAFLATTHPPSLRSRETVIALLWPESDQEHGRRSLRQGLHVLRRSLGRGAIMGEGDELVGVDVTRLWCDAAAFQETLRAGRRDEALTLYGGPFMDGFHLSNAPELERWIADERRRLEARAVAAAWALAGAAEQSADRAAARRWAERALDLSPYDEAGFRRYLGLLERQADRAAAVTAFDTYRKRLAEELGLEPSPETAAAMERIRGDATPAASQTAAASPAPAGGRAPPAAPTPGGLAGPRTSLTPAAAAGLNAPTAPAVPVPAATLTPSTAVLPSRAARVWRWAAAAVAIGAVGALAWWGLARRAGPAGSGTGAAVARTGAARGASFADTIPAKSIAVLPFENLSGNPDNAYFVGGIQDEILTALAHIADLKVISRESVMQYDHHPADVRAISRELGVANLLEGSVQRVGDRVRISVQLIDARRDAHLWTTTYDRRVSDVFAVESEVAHSIAAALRARLTPEEAQLIAAAPTRSTTANDWYLRGRAQENGQQWANSAAMREAANDYARAVAEDSTFVAAWARLGIVEALIYDLHDRTAQRRSLALQTIRRTLALAPDAGESQLALGYYDYAVGDFVHAGAAFRRAIGRLPNSSEAFGFLGFIERREGHWQAALVYQREAVARDPRNLQLISQMILNFAARRRFAETLAELQRALVLHPGDPGLRIVEAEVHQAEGDFDGAGRILSGTAISPSILPVFLTNIQQRLYTGHYQAAIDALKDVIAQPPPSLPHYLTAGVYGERLGFAERLVGDEAAARAAYTSARAALVAHLNANPDDAFMEAFLGLVEAGLGHRQAALAAGRRALRLNRRSQQGTEAAIEQILARIEAEVGDTGDAIAHVRDLLGEPFISNYAFGTLTPAFLQADRVWDPLRQDPRFAALVRGPRENHASR